MAAEQEAEKRLVRWLYQSSSLRKLQEDGLVLAGLQASGWLVLAVTVLCQLAGEAAWGLGFGVLV